MKDEKLRGFGFGVVMGESFSMLDFLLECCQV